jgi:hypothetical protein
MPRRPNHPTNLVKTRLSLTQLAKILPVLEGICIVQERVLLLERVARRAEYHTSMTLLAGHCELDTVSWTL